MSNYAESLSSKEAFGEYRETAILDVVRNLLLPLAEEKPFARWNSPQLIQHISEETCLAQTLVINHLKSLANYQTPLNEEGSALHLAVTNGQTYA